MVISSFAVLTPFCPLVLPLLLVGGQSSLDDDIDQEDIDNIVLSGTNVCRDFLAAAYEVFRIRRNPALC